MCIRDRVEALKQSDLYEKVLSFPRHEQSYLDKRFSREAEQLSGGEQQKLAISLSLIHILIDVQKYASSLGLRMNIQRDGLSAGGMVCYANRRNNYTLGSDEIIRKTTCEYDNPLNHLGYFNDQGDMVIDIEKENLWVDGYSLSLIHI